MLLPTPTQLEADLTAKNDSVVSCAEATHHLAAVMSAAHARFWSLPTGRLLAVLNANVTVTVETFAANTALGTAVNAALDAINRAEFPTRVPVVTGRPDIVFDGTAFAVAPPAS